MSNIDHWIKVFDCLHPPSSPSPHQPPWQRSSSFWGEFQLQAVGSCVLMSAFVSFLQVPFLFTFLHFRDVWLLWLDCMIHRRTAILLYTYRSWSVSFVHMYIHSYHIYLFILLHLSFVNTIPQPAGLNSLMFVVTILICIVALRWMAETDLDLTFIFLIFLVCTAFTSCPDRRSSSAACPTQAELSIILILQVDPFSLCPRL